MCNDYICQNSCYVSTILLNPHCCKIIHVCVIHSKKYTVPQVNSLPTYRLILPCNIQCVCVCVCVCGPVESHVSIVLPTLIFFIAVSVFVHFCVVLKVFVLILHHLPGLGEGEADRTLLQARVTHTQAAVLPGRW